MRIDGVAPVCSRGRCPPMAAAANRASGARLTLSRQSQLRGAPREKGTARRFEEARALKRSTEVMVEPCPECGADPDDEHASWCLATEDAEDEDEDEE